MAGARSNNLKDVHFRVPVGRLTSVVGVSESGKSTLVRTVFLPALRKALKLAHEDVGAYDTLKGATHVKRALAVDQSPIGRTPRSVPATFLGVWDEVQKLFASIPEAKARGYKPNRFSFNAGPGRCPSCEGQGSLLSEMAYLPDVVSVCETCRLRLSQQHWMCNTRDIQQANFYRKRSKRLLRYSPRSTRLQDHSRRFDHLVLATLLSGKDRTRCPAVKRND